METRIAIIGGGVSGIAAAYRLHKKGFRNVTLFEANDCIGGKARSVEIDGHVIEIGTQYSMNDSPAVFDMGRDLRVLRVRRVRPKFMVLWTRPRVRGPRLPLIDTGVAARSSPWSGSLQFGRLIISPQFRCLFKPGFHDLHPDLASLTMVEFARKYKFDALLEPCYVFTYGCGYGSLNDTATLYCLKFSKSLARVMLRRQASLSFHSGAYTFVWRCFGEKIAAHLAENGIQLRLGNAVSRVVRRMATDGPMEIAVIANGETSLYDRLVVTSCSRPNSAI